MLLASCHLIDFCDNVKMKIIFNFCIFTSNWCDIRSKCNAVIVLSFDKFFPKLSEIWNWTPIKSELIFSDFRQIFCKKIKQWRNPDCSDFMFLCQIEESLAKMLKMSCHLTNIFSNIFQHFELGKKAKLMNFSNFRSL